MNKILLILLLISILGGCTRAPDNIAADFVDDNGEIFKLANNQAVDFYFYYPENFIIDKNTVMISMFINDTETVIIEHETGEDMHVYVNPNLSASVYSMQELYESAEQCWESYVKPSLSAGFNNINIESSEDIIIAGISGRKYIYTASLGGQDYKYAQVIFLRSREIYTLIYSATPNRFEKHAGVLDVVTETFAFK